MSIKVQHVGKAYKYYPSKWNRVIEKLLPGDKPRHSKKWVLKDINFSIEPGEAVGIVGVNGAGKSTLLKLLTGTTQPTKGSIEIQGASPRCWSWAWASILTLPAGRTCICPG